MTQMNVLMKQKQIHGHRALTDLWWPRSGGRGEGLGVWDKQMQTYPLLLFSHVWFFVTPGTGTPGFPVFHHLPEFAKAHVCWASDAILPSHPVAPFPLAYLQDGAIKGFSRLGRELYSLSWNKLQCKRAWKRTHLYILERRKAPRLCVPTTKE